jgi:hypothetical protein
MRSLSWSDDSGGLWFFDNETDTIDFTLVTAVEEALENFQKELALFIRISN